MNILGLIPARGGSKGIPKKNITLLAGKPLLAYTCTAALASKALTRVILSTAHPAKFPDSMEQITGERPALPARLGGLLKAKEDYPVLANDLGAVEAYVASVARAVSEGAV